MKRERNPVRLFVIAAAADAAHQAALEKHLFFLWQQGLLENWQSVQPGEKTDDVFAEAKLILLLLSADCNADTLCQEQMQRALERQREGRVQVVPILLRPVEITDAPFAYLPMVPTNGKPVVLWENEDAAWMYVTEAIRCVLEGKFLPVMQEKKEEARYTTETSTVSVQNKQSNEGAQGIFYGPVTFFGPSRTRNLQFTRRTVFLGSVFIVVILMIVTFLLAFKPVLSYTFDDASQVSSWTTSGGITNKSQINWDREGHSSKGSLKVNTLLWGIQSEQRPSSDDAEHTEIATYFPALDVSGKQASCWIYVPSSMAPGNGYLSLFVKSDEGNNQYATKYGGKVYINDSLGKWTKLSFSIGDLDSHFDTTRVAALGINLQADKNSNFGQEQVEIYVDECSIG